MFCIIINFQRSHEAGLGLNEGDSGMRLAKSWSWPGGEGTRIVAGETPGRHQAVRPGTEADVSQTPSSCWDWSAGGQGAESCDWLCRGHDAGSGEQGRQSPRLIPSRLFVT